MADAVFIGIGSNIGDSSAMCKAAVRELVRDQRAACFTLSSLYTTSPVSDIVQRYFLNCALRMSWSGSPEVLLDCLMKIETSLGRTREIPDGPRTIDLDILLFEDMVLDGPSLTIPHPRLHVRKFALVPCLEIDPTLVHPRYGRPLAEFLETLGDEQKIEYLERIGEDEIYPATKDSCGFTGIKVTD